MGSKSDFHLNLSHRPHIVADYFYSPAHHEHGKECAPAGSLRQPPPPPPTPPGGIWFALNPLNFADQPEFGSQEEFSSPPQVYGWNELWPTRDFREAEADLLFLFFIRALHRP